MITLAKKRKRRDGEAGALCWNQREASTWSNFLSDSGKNIPIKGAFLGTFSKKILPESGNCWLITSFYQKELPKSRLQEISNTDASLLRLDRVSSRQTEGEAGGCSRRFYDVSGYFTFIQIQK